MSIGFASLLKAFMLLSLSINSCDFPFKNNSVSVAPGAIAFNSKIDEYIYQLKPDVLFINWKKNPFDQK